MSFKIKALRRSGISVIRISGDVCGSDSVVVSEKILSRAGKKGGNIAIDLSEATFLDSHGLGVFVYAWRMLQEQGRELVFLNPPPFVKKIFTGTNLDNVFRVVDDIGQI